MYLLDQVSKLENGSPTARSFLISQQKIQYVNASFNMWSKRRLNLKGFILQSGKIMADEQLLGLEVAPFLNQQRQLLKKGCTTVIVFSQVNYEKQIITQYTKAKHQMTNSTLDFVIGLTINVNMLRPTVLRTCQKYKIPVIKVLVKNTDNLSDIPWTHLAQAMLTYPVFLLLDIPNSYSKKEKTAIENNWFWFCKKYRIQTGNVPNHQTPWSRALIQKIGLYPTKGELVVGSDVDYLLYLEKSRGINRFEALSVDEQRKLDYDEEEPCIVVVRGRNLKVNEDYALKPGFGHLVQVKKPGRFLSISEAHGFIGLSNGQ